MRLAPDDLAEMMLAPEPGFSRITVSAVINASARHYGIAPGLLTEPDGGAGQRQRWIARKRHVAMYLARELTPHSTIQIGEMFGRRDHTTVMYACKQVKERLAEGRDFSREDVRNILRRLGIVQLEPTA
jgi:chromosomal replication initiator protein